VKTTFDLFPYLPYLYYVLLFMGAFALFAIAWRAKLSDLYGRGIFFLGLALLLLNPVFMNEMREALPDRLVVVVDESSSQRIGGRDQVTEKALQHIQEQSKKGVEPIIIRAAATTGAKGESTELFSALRENLTNMPLGQVAGTILITDGQVHDVPAEAGVFERLAPFHVILTGKKKEFDRKVTIVSAPKYGVLNESISISVKVEEYGAASKDPVTLSLLQDGEKQEEVTVVPGEERSFDLTLRHPGQNVFEFSIPNEEGELTHNNNTAPVIVNAVRDRMRVLLVSGAPHMGERAWRNLLKSDPSIDLVHFTILRSPMSMDPTPQNQLALIVFPVEQLFREKIDDFDLIIFDRYQQYGLLLPEYFDNIANFIKNGGAFLMAMGGEQTDGNVFNTSLGQILPVVPQAAENLNDRFTPKMTKTGMTHPVTADLTKGAENWGSWYSQSDVRAASDSAQVLMTGVNDKPLLVLGQSGEGRMAVLSSDNIWLWSKEAAKAGPYTDLLRHTAHWLMKEPELEDGFIKAEVEGRNITVSQRDIGNGEKSITMKNPAGDEKTITLTEKENGWARSTVKAEADGIYSFSNGGRKTFAVVGTSLSQEFSDVRTTEEKLKPLVTATGGTFVWFQERPDFSLRPVSASTRTMGGEEWLGLRENKAYTVSNVVTSALLPDWLAISLIFAGIILMWRREGSSQ
jgi:hypothetical protein